MMSCTRLYVEPIEALICQSRKKEAYKPSKASMIEHKGGEN